jgi:Tetratricopeptide repeat/Bacterial SH3 domain
VPPDVLKVSGFVLPTFRLMGLRPLRAGSQARAAGGKAEPSAYRTVGPQVGNVTEPIKPGKARKIIWASPFLTQEARLSFLCGRTIRISLVVLWLLGTPAWAQESGVRQFLEAGNQSYAQGNFKAAIEQYEKIVQIPFVNEVAYYNLGNAYFKDGQLGKAILYYEKAHRLSPGDREIADNLSFAKMRISDKVEKPPEGFLVTQSTRLLNLLPLDVETFLAVICFVAANGCFTLFVLGPSPSLSRLALYASFGLLALFLLFGASNLFRIYQSETAREGVILTDKVDVLSGPSTDNPTLFSIHEGLKVRIENEVQDWLQISLENGWNGWVKKETLGVI